jgi:putative endonuclease
MHYVYIIQSKQDRSYYKGYSLYPTLRLIFHNEGKSTYTVKKLPWILVAVFEFCTKKEALEKEKKLKKYGHKSLESLIYSDKNIVHLYLKGLENS